MKREIPGLQIMEPVYSLWLMQQMARLQSLVPRHFLGSLQTFQKDQVIHCLIGSRWIQEGIFGSTNTLVTRLQDLIQLMEHWLNIGYQHKIACGRYVLRTNVLVEFRMLFSFRYEKITNCGF